jgi:uncharacterized damage-inducible protein DinB
MNLTIDELLNYTEEERAKWQDWFSIHGNDPLKITLAGGTFPNIGALILHCFWAELWYAYWMRGEILTENSEIVRQNNNLPTDQAEVISSFGQSDRKTMRSFTSGAGPAEWERIHEVEARGFHIQGSARKLISHILVHEIRHWAQVALAVRQRDLAPPGDHDLLFSKSYGPLVRRV